MQKTNKIEETVRNIALPLIEQAGFELVDLEYQKEGNNWVLRLFIDHENGIDHEACELISNLVGDKLDKLDPIPHAYFLEVSSPGIERPLKSAKDFQRFSGEKVHIKLFAPKNGQKEYNGKLLGMERDHVTILVDGSKLTFNMDEIAKAQLIVDF
ncbi:MAG: ribosome maturation factor RimP [Bacillota bacterium]|jgi:ribosome maturation factor RimP